MRRSTRTVNETPVCPRPRRLPPSPGPGRRTAPHANHARSIRRGQITGSFAHTSELLTELMPEWKWTQPSGGNAHWIHTCGDDAVALSEQDQRHGVHINPGSIFSPREAFRDYLRLPLTTTAPLLREAIERIAAARNPSARDKSA